MTRKYTLTNLDCPTCAQRIEDDLKQLPTVKTVSVDFNTLSMQVDTDDIDSVRKRIGSIEPDVGVHDLRHTESSISAGNDLYGSGKDVNKAHRRDTYMLLASVLLLATAIFVEKATYIADLRWVALPIFVLAYLLAGSKTLVRAGKNIMAGRLFDEYFLMAVATIGAFVLREYGEAVAVMAFFKAGQILENRSVRRSRGAIQDLLNLQPDTARIDRDGETETVPLSEVTVGDVMIVRPGERIPTDGIVVDGSSSVDTSGLTGEPAPRRVEVDAELLGGYLNIDGLIRVQVTTPSESSSAAKISEMVDKALERKANTEVFITRFAKVYTPIVISVAVLIATVPPLVISSVTFSDALYRALTLLVISCPCALVISIPLTYFAAIGGASSRGILVKGASVLDALANATTFVFDKTGTMTHGEFDIQHIVPHGTVGREELLSLAATAERESNHPIARSILKSVTTADMTAVIGKYEERRGRGVVTEIGGQRLIAGNDPLLHEEQIDHDTCEIPGAGTAVHVARNGIYAGYIVIGDRLRHGASKVSERLKHLGARLTVLLTGDHHGAARDAATELRLDRAYGNLLPEDKVTRLEEIMSTEGLHGKTVFIGDGINDAPVIARADVGVAMGLDGTEAAIDTADVVLMSHDPGTIVDAVARARRTRRIILQNLGIIFAIKGVALLLGAMGIATMWQAVIADTGVTIITVLNAIRALK